MSSRTLNVLAITIFSVTMLSLVGPLVGLSPTVPALTTAGLLGLITVDTLGWQGRGLAIFLDWVAGLSAEHRDRVVRHEAGHMLVAHLLEIPVTGYALTTWEAVRLGYPGQAGTQFDAAELEAQVRQGKLKAQLLDRYCTVWMAGIAAEQLAYGQAEGGTGDREQVQALLIQLGWALPTRQQKERWAMRQATTLLEAHQAAYTALVDALQANTPIADCQQLLHEQAPITSTTTA